MKKFLIIALVCVVLGFGFCSQSSAAEPRVTFTFNEYPYEDMLEGEFRFDIQFSSNGIQYDTLIMVGDEESILYGSTEVFINGEWLDAAYRDITILDGGADWETYQNFLTDYGLFMDVTFPEEQVYTISGIWKLPVGANLTGYDFDEPNLRFIHTNKVGTFDYISLSLHPSSPKGAVLRTTRAGSGVNFHADSYYSTLSKELILDFGSEDQFVSKSCYDFFNNVGVRITCDGSACNVEDFNIDGVCDTCGAPLAYSVKRSYAPDGWPSAYPLPPIGSEENHQYLIMTRDGETHLYLFYPISEEIVIWDGTGHSTNVQVTSRNTSGDKVYVRRYTYLLSGGDWVQQDNQTVTSTIFGLYEDVTMRYSTIDLKYADGTPFFPVPLWVEVEKVTQGELPTMGATMGGTLMILTACGVGCLALLVVLSLFGKRSLIFRR